MTNDLQNRPAISVRHLTKTYGTHTVVDDMTFDVPAGRVVGLIGPNGSGKTTTMKSLLGLVKPSGGDIHVLDATVGAPGWGSVLTRVGSMIEEPPIYANLTTRQNLQYQSIAVTGSVDAAQIDEILLLIDLASRADERPKKYSLGMKQRLGIGISLIGKPELVILDEPANGLDPAGIIEIRQLLRRLPESGTTVLVSSHQLAEVQQACDQLVIIANGRMITQGTTDEILRSQTAHRFDLVVAASELDAAMDSVRHAGIEVTATDNGRFVATPPADVDGAALNRLLVGAGIFASSISQPTASLEEAFLDLVRNQA
jgi:ABC-2 type transport system ATP-binding protein